jgi:[CysO sulfur-carrier protein]-S-L-cysteine hydrolase
MHSIILTKEQLQQMIDHVDAHAPLEACGLLAGRDSKVEKIFLVQNQARSAVRFVMNPVEQLAAFAWIDSKGMDLLGIFHSHPTGPETVSATDIAEAAYAVVHVILSHMDKSWHARGFWIEDNDYTEAALQIM